MRLLTNEQETRLAEEPSEYWRGEWRRSWELASAKQLLPSMIREDRFAEATALGIFILIEIYRPPADVVQIRDKDGYIR